MYLLTTHLYVFIKHSCICKKNLNRIQSLIMSHSTSSEQIAEPDPFRFGSNFAHVFIGPKWEILKIFGPLDPLLPP